MKPQPEIEVKNEINIETIAPALGDYTGDLKQEVKNQRITVREGNNPLRAYYFAILNLNKRFKEREVDKLKEFYAYGGGNYIDSERFESLYLLNNRVVHVHFPYIDIKDSLSNMKVYNQHIVEKYFTVTQQDNEIRTALGGVYYIPVSKLRFGFVNELAANIATAKIGKQNGLKYESYKKKAEIRLEYLKEVYNYIKQKKTPEAECVGQLIVLLEKELMRL
jgi:hypothetical protein